MSFDVWITIELSKTLRARTIFFINNNKTKKWIFSLTGFKNKIEWLLLLVLFVQSKMTPNLVNSAQTV